MTKMTPCPECAGEGKSVDIDDDGEPAVYKSGKKQGEVKPPSKCAACDGEGEIEA